MEIKTYILGADDPEMSEIETLLRQAGQQVRYAVTEDGKRVNPLTAYSAAGFVAVLGGEIETAKPEQGFQTQFRDDVVFIECSVRGIVPGRVVDHHRLGDPGYGRPPAEYWEASSIGQGCELLGLARPGRFCAGCEDVLRGSEQGDWEYCQSCGRTHAREYLKFVAAADHCLAAAYAGQCPGVDPAKLEEFRIKQLCSASRARNRGEARTPEQVRASIERATVAIESAPWLALLEPEKLCASCREGSPMACTGNCPRGVYVKDLRGQQVRDLPEAAIIMGVGYLAGGVSLREGEPAKLVIGGCGEGTIPGTAPVEAFLAAARAGNVAGTPVHTDGELKPYGDPVRGFAGAYNRAG